MIRLSICNTNSDVEDDDASLLAVTTFYMTHESASRRVLICIDGSSMEITSLVDVTLNLVVQPGTTVFLVRVQTETRGEREHSYDDVLLRAASKVCREKKVETVETLIQTDDDANVSKLLLEKADEISPFIVVVGRNELRANSVGVSATLLRSRHSVLACNFAPRVVLNSDLAKRALLRAESASESWP